MFIRNNTKKTFQNHHFRAMSDKIKFDTQKFADNTGEYKRKVSSFRDVIQKGGKFEPEAGRYHLYVSYACPWAHRTLISRKLKGLDKLIDISVVHWHMDSKGWRFKTPDESCPGANEEPNYGFKRLSDLYFKADENYGGRFTVPTLWDKKNQTIVNNESSEIIRFFNSAFNDSDVLTKEEKAIDLYPVPLRKEIDELNNWIYDTINNGVYKAGFATKQEVYESHVKTLFEHLEKVEAILKNKYNAANDPNKDGFYLVGDELTEADVRLYTTLVRFDPVYVQHFKCNIKDIRHGFPYLHKYVRYLYWNIPAFHETTNFDHIKKHYTKSHPQINPHGITPVGPVPDILPLD
ncbi:S-glutathionyl-(chloro)hydroquinone reductase [Saccharomycopsis crataegensis]|uniref:Glutathione S-transferase omega-like 2 n=1 Tax=Saccharomycopsis crataegensis TaxID=43959 RepID=A0AAV5QI95_9ASCO|nr:S-glutathionyl-(chloro)hydroquinone reductase [Saccharomycopsis crataegensis]